VPRWKNPKLLSSVAMANITGSGKSPLYLKIPIIKNGIMNLEQKPKTTTKNFKCTYS
jgi:hypothetical protein